MDAYRKVLGAKIHRARVTHADLHYEGSITVPPELMAAADFVEHEAVHVWNVTTGTRFETYVMTGRAGSGEICINGAAAHLAKPDDIVIIASFIDMPEAKLRGYQPKVVFVDENNRIKEIKSEIPGPLRRVGF